MSTKKIGAKIVLDGEAEFRQSVNNSKSALKAFDSELKLAQAQFKGNEKSMEALKKTQEVYLKQQKELQKQEKAYVDQLKKASEAHETAKKKQEETAKTITDLNKQLENAKRQYGDNSKEVEDLNKELEKAENEYKKQGTAIGTLEGKMSKWEQGLNETRTQLVEVDQNLEETNKNIENFGDSMDEVADSTKEANPELSQLSLSMGKLVSADLVADGIRRLASSVVDLAKASIDVGMQFEASMSKVEALSGATGEELEVLTEKAREMGSTTMFSASEAADAFSYMALAGWDTRQMLEGIEPVLNLAASANMDLAEASDIVTDYLTAFGLEAKDASKFTDQLAYAMANSNTDVEMLGEAYKNCAAAAGSMGYSVEDVTSALMTMANAGVKGGEAGTSLRSIMINLATDTNGCATELENFGVEIYDLETGEMNSLSDILIQTASAFDGLSDAEANSLAKVIAGKTQFTGFETILLGLNDAAKESGMSFEDYAEALQNCDGYAKEMANTMQNNLQGKLTILESSLEALGESVYDVFSEDLKSGVDGATDAVSRLNEAVKHGDLNTSLKKISASVDELIDKVIDWVEDTLPKIVNGMADLIDNADTIIPLIEGIVAGFLAFKSVGVIIEGASVAMSIYEAATAAATLEQLALNLAIEANPLGLLAGAIATVVAGLVVWCETQESSIDRAEKWNDEAKKMVEKYNTMSDSIKKYSEESNKLLDDLETEKKSTENLVSELDKLSNAEKQSTEDKNRMQSIVAELNSKYKDLNLSLEDQNGKLVVSTANWKDLINTQLKTAQVEAIQERLTEAYKEQYNADLELYEIQSQLNDIEEEYGDKLKELEKLYDSNTEASQSNIDRMYELENELGEVIPKYDELQNSLVEAQKASDDNSASLERMNEFLNENSIEIENNAQAQEEATSTIVRLTEEQKEAYADALEAAQKSIGGQSGLFTELSLKVDTTIGQMSNNLKSQTEVFNTFASDLEKASALADQSSDPHFKAIVASLESMGIDGAGYLHELVEAAESNTEEFNELIENWSLMTTARENLVETMAQFETDYTTGTDLLKTRQEEFKESTETTTEEMTENVKETVATANEEIQQNVDESLKGYEASLEQARPVVENDAQELANATKDPVENTVTYDAFHEFGENAGRGLAEGLRSMVEEVRAAAQELADAANTAVSGPDGLDEHSPSKKMHNFGYLGGVGLADGFKEAMPRVISTINDMMPNERNVEISSFQNVSMSTNTEGNSTLAKIDSLLTEYLPVLSNLKVVMDTGVTVGALAPGMNKALGRLATRSKAL